MQIFPVEAAPSVTDCWAQGSVPRKLVRPVRSCSATVLEEEEFELDTEQEQTEQDQTEQDQTEQVETEKDQLLQEDKATILQE